MDQLMDQAMPIFFVMLISHCFFFRAEFDMTCREFDPSARRGYFVTKAPFRLILPFAPGQADV
jgi:hypothetical protein